MKRLLKRLLAAVGLAPAGGYRALERQLRESHARAKHLSALLKESKSTSQEWKIKAGQANERVHQLTIELRSRAKIIASNEKAQAHQIESLQKRVADAERELTLTREELMIMEAKLDVLEGAANVLDLRTRSVFSQRPGRTGAPV